MGTRRPPVNRVIAMPDSGPMLDHVAVAVESWAQAWPRYVTGLGGRWASGGRNIGFAPAQLSFANGARLEVLQPWEPEANPFLRRFLDGSGPGPHHLTFKVPDIASALDAVGAAGFSPVSVDLSDPGWKEAFLHPRQAGGIVVQLAQAAGYWESPPPEGFPPPADPPASLSRVTHVVADLDAALELFGSILAGAVERHPRLASGTEVATVCWAGPLALRLVAPSGADTELSRFLGERPGRLHHLAFVLPGATSIPADATTPAEVPGLLEGEHALGVVPAGDNLGTGLLLLSGDGGDGGPSAAAR